MRAALSLRPGQQSEQPYEVAQELKPQKEQAAPGIPDLAGGVLHEDTGGDIVRNLCTQVLLDFPAAWLQARAGRALSSSTPWR